jgi:hypothetical protein
MKPADVALPHAVLRPSRLIDLMDWCVLLDFMNGGINRVSSLQDTRKSMP